MIVPSGWFGIARLGIVQAGLGSIVAVIGPPWPLSLNVFALGVSNGAFTVAAIGFSHFAAKGERYALDANNLRIIRGCCFRG